LVCYNSGREKYSRTSTGAVPARATKLAALPRTFIGVGAVDLFVDEDVEYARRLINAGVKAFLYALVAQGEAGVLKAIDIIRSELQVSMGLAGQTDVTQVSRSVLRSP
jgi:acetyl esterase/lipase